MAIDLLIHSAAQVVTCASKGPKRRQDMADVGAIAHGAVAVDGGAIVDVGDSDDLRRLHTARAEIDASGKTVCPGLIDPHTHVLYAGDRVDEFEMRLRGASYMDIMRAGGGIRSTVAATRGATLTQLVEATSARLRAMQSLGTTTVEIKSGYGLDSATELEMLLAMETLARETPLDIVPTFLGAHAVPPEYEGRADDFVRLVVDVMLPAVAAWYGGSIFRQRGIPLFADVFCEDGAFDLDQTRRILTAATNQRMGIKLHADEFVSLGGVSLAVDFKAASVDHLDVTPPDEVRRLAESDTIGIVLPAVNFNLGSTHFADARAMIEAGVALALSTDANPGSAPCLSLPLVMGIACRYQRLTPAEALNACTLNAAYAVGLADRLGSIEVGKQADLLVIGAPDYRHLAYRMGENLVERVVKLGQIL